MKPIIGLTVLSAFVSVSAFSSGDNVVIGVEQPRGVVEYENVPSPSPVTVQVFKKTAPATPKVETASIKPLYSSSDIAAVHASSAAVPVEKKVNDAKQNNLLGTTQAYLMVSSPDDRVFVGDDGNVHFHAFAGSLHSNVTALLKSTNTIRPIIWEVSEQHVFPSDIWLVGDSVLSILDKLLSSYNEPHPIKAWTWENRIVEVHYDKKDRRD